MRVHRTGCARRTRVFGMNVAAVVQIVRGRGSGLADAPALVVIGEAQIRLSAAVGLDELIQRIVGQGERAAAGAGCCAICSRVAGDCAATGRIALLGQIAVGVVFERSQQQSTLGPCAYTAVGLPDFRSSNTDL